MADNKSQSETLASIKKAVIEGDSETSKSATERALTSGISPHEIIDELKEGIEIVGYKFSEHEYFIPDLVMSGAAMDASLQILLPGLHADKVHFAGRVIIGSVRGDVHNLGKSIVVTMLRGAGFEVKDLGVDVSPSEFVEAAKREKPQIVAASAYMSTTVPELGKVNNGLKNAGLAGNVKYLIGGAAVYPEHVRSAGADGYGKDAFEAVAIAKKLVQEI